MARRETQEGKSKKGRKYGRCKYKCAEYAKHHLRNGKLPEHRFSQSKEKRVDSHAPKNEALMPLVKRIRFSIASFVVPKIGPKAAAKLNS